MIETLRKVVLAGIGTLDLTEEKLQAGLADLIKRGEVSEREAHEFGKEWQAQLTRRREQLQQEAREAVQRALKAFNVASRSDFEALAARVEALERRASRPEPVDAEC
jgi:polyhydroxyalkanoate synthesis regulator phasin